MRKTVLEQEIELTAREITKIDLELYFNFRAFPFTETMVRVYKMLDADSDVTAQITFLNEKGEVVGLPQRKRFCPLQTYEEAQEEGCTFRLPIGENQSGPKTLQFLDDPIYRIGVNKALLDGQVRKVKFLVEAGLTIRKNTWAGPAGAEIEVVYSDFKVILK